MLRGGLVTHTNVSLAPSGLEPARLYRIPVPWLSDERQDWFAAAREWIADRVAVCGLGDLISADVHRERRWGVIISIRTTRGRLFFKAIDPARKDEIPITAAVGSRWQTLAPEVLAVDQDRRFRHS